MADEPCRRAASSETEKGHFEDEVLETIWELREKKGSASLEDVLAEHDESGVMGMQRDGLIEVREGAVSLTEDGSCRARDVTRRHLLAERLFADVLDLSEYEEDACRFEHAISAEVEEAICTLLGHPPTCPHGRPIPRGKCCELFTRKLKPLVQSLRDMEVGKTAKVLFINAPAMERLAAIGLVPGVALKLIQKMPSFVIQIEETTIAIDEDIAKGIYARGHEGA